MTYNVLAKLIIHELDFLRYYGYRKHRELLTIEIDLYGEMDSIGYCKRVIPLDKRCPAGMLTSEKN